GAGSDAAVVSCDVEPARCDGHVDVALPVSKREGSPGRSATSRAEPTRVQHRTPRSALQPVHALSHQLRSIEGLCIAIGSRQQPWPAAGPEQPVVVSRIAATSGELLTALPVGTPRGTLFEGETDGDSAWTDVEV